MWREIRQKETQKNREHTTTHNTRAVLSPKGKAGEPAHEEQGSIELWKKSAGETGTKGSSFPKEGQHARYVYSLFISRLFYMRSKHPAILFCDVRQKQRQGTIRLIGILIGYSFRSEEKQ